MALRLVGLGQGGSGQPSQFVRPAWLGGVLAGISMVLAGCGSPAGDAADAASVSDAASPTPAAALPSVRNATLDPGQSLNVSTVCPPVTDGKTMLTVSFEVVNLGDTDVSITGVKALLPFGGMFQHGRTTSGGTCLNTGTGSVAGVVPAGESQLYTMNFKVPPTCPQNQQIQAVISLVTPGGKGQTTVPVLPNLKKMQFDNC